MIWPEAGKLGVFVQLGVYMDPGCKHKGVVMIQTEADHETRV